jgi:hypothetical protein
MNMKLKTLVAAVAMVAAGAAQAAIVDDGVNGISGPGLTYGTGNGELFLSVYDPGRTLSMVLDLNLTVNQFRNNNTTLIDTFSVTNSTLQSFIAGGTASQMKWNMGGLSNMGLGADFGIVTTNGNAGATISPSENMANGNGLTSAMGGASQYIINNNLLLVGDATPAHNSNQPDGHNGGVWGNNINGALPFDNQITGFSSGGLMSYFYADETNPLDGIPLVTTFSNGEWKIDPTLGKVSYVSAVPVPAAVWLFGSGLLGLVGISRRRKPI